MNKPRNILKYLTNPLLLLPAVAIDIVFLIFPFFYGLYLSFMSSMKSPTFTLENYVYCFSGYSSMLLTTVEMAALITIILIVVSLPIAYFLAIKIKSDAIKTLILLVILAPFWIDWNIRTIAWYPVFGAGGFVSTIHLWIMHALGYHSVQPISLLYTLISIIITWIQSYLLFMVVPIYLILLRMDPTILKAASTLRAGTFKTFYHITLKWSFPGIIIGSVFVFSLAMVDYATPILIGGGLPTIGVTVWNLGRWVQWPKAMAMSMIILALILVVIAVALRKVSVTRIIY